MTLLLRKSTVSIIYNRSKSTFTARFLSQSLQARNQQIPTYNVAIVGAGPAGFYTAHHMLNKSSPKDQFKLNVDFFDRLPAPYGLSRYGVAPDHPEVKNCEEYLDKIMEKYSLGVDNHSVRFFGNVNIGKDITLKQLESQYHSIILSYGCTSADNQLEIPGHELPGVISARQLVNWYNGHPDCYSNKGVTFTPPDLRKIEDVTIIGNGNVALDVARILLADPETHWSSTDICSEALKVLRESKIKNVNIIARRGLLESAFSNKEIRELLELSNSNQIKFFPIEDKVLNEIQPFTKKLGRVDKRKVSLLEKFTKQAKEQLDEKIDPNTKTWSLQYFKSPVEFIENSDDATLLSQTKVKINTLKHDPLTQTTNIITSSSDDAETQLIKNELVVLSIGYQGSPLIGFEDVNVSFDTKQNRILNHEGRILLSSGSISGSEDEHNFKYKKGWYTAGWIKKGPKGVIATTMMESFETGDQVLEDLTNGIYNETVPTINDNNIDEFLKDIKFINWQGWNKINERELENGSNLGKTREKLFNADEMLKIASS